MVIIKFEGIAPLRSYFVIKVVVLRNWLKVAVVGVIEMLFTRIMGGGDVIGGFRW